MYNDERRPRNGQQRLGSAWSDCPPVPGMPQKLTVTTRALQTLLMQCTQGDDGVYQLPGTTFEATLAEGFDPLELDMAFATREIAYHEAEARFWQTIRRLAEETDDPGRAEGAGEQERYHLEQADGWRAKHPARPPGT